MLKVDFRNLNIGAGANDFITQPMVGHGNSNSSGSYADHWQKTGFDDYVVSDSYIGPVAISAPKNLREIQ